MVFLFHTGGVFTQYHLGSAGVQFFFVLSGFILAYNYHAKFPELRLGGALGFYRARFAKIYPVHVLTFLIAAPLVILHFDPDGLYALKLAFMSAVNLLLVQSFVPNQGTYFNFNGVSWTLSVEAFFYLTFPFLLVAARKLGIAGRWAGSLFVMLAAWAVLFVLNAGLSEDDALAIWALHILPVARLFEFVSGLLLGLLFVRHGAAPRASVRPALFGALEAAAVVLFAALLFFAGKLDVSIVRGV